MRISLCKRSQNIGAELFAGAKYTLVADSRYGTRRFHPPELASGSNYLDYLHFAYF